MLIEDRPLYTPKRVARYLGLPEVVLKTWVKETLRHAGGRDGGGEEPPPLLLSLNDVVEANVFAALHHALRFSAKRAWQVVEEARRVLGLPRPFLLDFEGGLGKAILGGRSLSPLRRSALRALQKALEAYSRRVDRDEKGAPFRFWPALGGEIRGKWVVLDPRVASGFPAVRGVETWVLSWRYNAGEGLDELARDYGLPKEAVREAIVFEGLAPLEKR